MQMHSGTTVIQNICKAFRWTLHKNIQLKDHDAPPLTNHYNGKATETDVYKLLVMQLQQKTTFSELNVTMYMGSLHMQ